jgi:hypothetical protein
MTHDPLEALLRLRRMAADEARRGLGECLRIESEAAAAVAAIEAAIERETEAARCRRCGGRVVRCVAAPDPPEAAGGTGSGSRSRGSNDGSARGAWRGARVGSGGGGDAGKARRGGTGGRATPSAGRDRRSGAADRHHHANVNTSLCALSHGYAGRYASVSSDRSLRWRDTYCLGLPCRPA